MAAAASQPRRHQPTSLRRAPPPPPSPAAAKPEPNGKASNSKPASPVQASSERTVKKLRLTKALTLPEATAVSEACRRMAVKRVDAALLTDSNGMLSGILTAEDISGRVIAEGLRPDETNVAKVMTRNPVFVMSNSSAIEALQKMVKGKFRHLPVVEHGEVIAMLDITKFLYDAISRMEKAAEQGSAIAAAMEGVERQWGNDFPGPHSFIENLRDQLFKPSLSTIITENSSVPAVSPSDPVIAAAKKMREYRVNSVVVMTGNMLLGILTSKDLVLRVVAQSLSPDVTLVEKVMTTNPDCATLDTSILEALHSMQDGKFLHIPVADKSKYPILTSWKSFFNVHIELNFCIDGQIIACLDALQLTHAAISMVEGASEANIMANTMMQKFWDSALALQPAEESDARSAVKNLVRQHRILLKGSIYPRMLAIHSPLNYKIEKGVCTDSVVFVDAVVQNFDCVSESLDELVSVVSYRLGMENEKARINLLYDDDEGDRVVLTTDGDLSAAIQHARSAGWKVLRLHMDEPWSNAEHTTSFVDTSPAKTGLPFLWLGIGWGAVAVASMGVIFYLKRSEL
uniref:CBS domain-containing protein n=1 Tax=Oryza punctata TaxID=4537 RepID=A0A0E0JTY1_ORYPU